MSFLSSGHSHEDVDGMFSNIRAWLARHPELWCPEDFKSCLEQFFDVRTHRPHETFRKVVMMSKFRDWTLFPLNEMFWFYCFSFCFIISLVMN